MAFRCKLTNLIFSFGKRTAGPSQTCVFSSGCLRNFQTYRSVLAPLTSSPSTVATHENPNRVTCTLIPGDGVWPEMMNCVMEVFKAISVPVDFQPFFVSEVQHNLSAPLDDVCKSVNKNRIALKGVLSTPYMSLQGDLQSLNMRLRRQLDLFANVCHIKSIPGLKTRHKDIDFIIIREAKEGEYSALEHESVAGVVECMKIVTRENSYRIAKFAFDFATKLNRKKITAVHKANIMKLGDGLFLRCCEEVASLYPKIEFNNMIIDNCTMQLVSNPGQFDVLVMPNLYGNIIDNLAAGLVGGAGVVAGESYSGESVVFEPGARHAFSEAIGKNVANPTGILLTATNMLVHANMHNYAKIIRDALFEVLSEGKIRTRDIGGQASTTEFLSAVISRLRVP